MGCVGVSSPSTPLPATSFQPINTQKTICVLKSIENLDGKTNATSLNSLKNNIETEDGVGIHAVGKNVAALNPNFQCLKRNTSNGTSGISDFLIEPQIKAVCEPIKAMNAPLRVEQQRKPLPEWKPKRKHREDV